MISPGLTPPGPSPLPQIDAEFGGWDSPQISPPLSPHGIGLGDPQGMRTSL